MSLQDDSCQKITKLHLNLSKLCLETLWLLFFRTRCRQTQTLTNTWQLQQYNTIIICLHNKEKMHCHNKKFLPVGFSYHPWMQTGYIRRWTDIPLCKIRYNCAPNCFITQPGQTKNKSTDYSGLNIKTVAKNYQTEVTTGFNNINLPITFS